MGKRPVVGLIGLVWAGIALTGCGECCRNCRNNNTGKFNTPPTFQTRNNPANGAKDTPEVASEGTPTGTPVSKGMGPAGAQGFASPSGLERTGGTAPPAPDMTPLGGTGSSLPPVSSLRPTTEERRQPAGLPGRMDEGSGMPVSPGGMGGKGGMSPENARAMPPVPVVPPTSAANVPDPPSPTPAAPSEALPPITGSGSMAPPPGATPMPQTRSTGSEKPPFLP
jgi:hypothetical protein